MMSSFLRLSGKRKTQSPETPGIISIIFLRHFSVIQLTDRSLDFFCGHAPKHGCGLQIGYSGIQVFEIDRMYIYTGIRYLSGIYLILPRI